MNKLNRLLRQDEVNEPGVIKETVEQMRLFDSSVVCGLRCREWEYGWGIGNLLKFLKDKNLKDIKWLDIGSASSTLPFYLASLGIDISVYEFPEYQDFFMKHSVFPPVTFIPIEHYERSISDAWNDLGYHINADTSSFDVVTCISVLEHLPHHEETNLIKEIARVIKSNGLLFFTTDVNQVRNYHPHLRAGNNKWHIYDRQDLQKDVLNPCVQYGLELIGNQIEYVPGLEENKLEHTNLHNILSFFMRKI
jgi:SAM-dependent methyltransferase